MNGQIAPETRQRKPWYRPWWVWVIGVLAVLAAMAILGNLLPDTEDPEQAAAPTETATVEASPTPSEQQPEPATEPESSAAEETTDAPTRVATPSEVEESFEAATPTEAAETTAAEPQEESGLSGRVESALLEGNAVDSFQALQPSSPGFWISDIEDVSSGTVRVYMQTALSDPERDNAAHWVMNMSCLSVEDLDTVVIRDTSGIDSNHFKFSMERVLPGCRD